MSCSFFWTLTVGGGSSGKSTGTNALLIVEDEVLDSVQVVTSLRLDARESELLTEVLVPEVTCLSFEFLKKQNTSAFYA